MVSDKYLMHPEMKNAISLILISIVVLLLLVNKMKYFLVLKI